MHVTDRNLVSLVMAYLVGNVAHGHVHGDVEAHGCRKGGKGVHVRPLVEAVVGRGVPVGGKELQGGKLRFQIFSIKRRKIELVFSPVGREVDRLSWVGMAWGA